MFGKVMKVQDFYKSSNLETMKNRQNPLEMLAILRSTDIQANPGQVKTDNVFDSC